jgi:SpoVK/Ycf46/Vps4 family AAA+-type ATPase
MPIDDNSALALATEGLRGDRKAVAATIKRLAGECAGTGLAKRLTQALSHAEKCGFMDEDRQLMQLLPKDGTLDLLERRVTRRGLADVALDAAAIEVVTRVIEENTDPKTYLDHGFRPANRLIMMGPPGTGKTATAEAIAKEMGLPFLVARMDAILESHLGGTARNLRKIFDFLDKAPRCVLLFDEFDAIASNRAGSGTHTELGEIKRVTNSLLAMLDAYDGHSLILATTNLDTVVDPAVWRRFDEALYFPAPTPDAAWAYFTRVAMDLLAMAPTDKARDLYDPKLAGLSFAEIERVTTRAAKRVVFHDTPMSDAMDMALVAERHKEAARPA